MTLRKWQREYRDHIATLSEEDLFDEMIDAQVADGWDGCFTDRARWCANESTRQVHDKYIHDAKLAALVTPELAALLEWLVSVMRHADVVFYSNSQLAVAEALAARIREALALEANDD